MVSLSKKIVLSLVSIFISLFAIEMWARNDSKIGFVPAGIHRYHPLLNYAMKPHFSGRTFGVPFKTNSKGFRDVERLYPKDPETFRILCIGDSYIFGYGLPFEQTLPQLLQNRLKFRFPGRKIEVLNLSVPATDTPYHAKLLALEGLNYHPDVVILSCNHTDSYLDQSFLSRESGWLYHARFFLRNFQIYHFFVTRVYTLALKMTGKWGEPVLERRDDIASRYADDYIGWIESKKAFKDIRNLANDHPFEVVFVIYPRFERLEDYPFGVYHQKLKEAWRNEPHVLDLLEVFGGKRDRDFWVRPFDGHPNALANEMIARRLEQFLIKRHLI